MLHALILTVGLMSLPLQADEIPQLTPKECPAAYAEAGADCYTLTVYQDREEPELGTLDLNVVVMPAASDDPTPDPVVFIPGGPGGGAVAGGPGRYPSGSLRAERAIVLMDPRGTGGSEPLDMSCPEVGPAALRDFQVLPAERTVFNAQAEAYALCSERLAAEGIELDNFNTGAMVADYEDLRAALGYEVWNLHGVSYGSYVAMRYMQQQPEAIRAAILELPSTPERSYQQGFVDIARNFEKILDRCMADPECAAAYPNLRTDFYDLLDNGDEPLFTVTTVVEGEAVELYISSFDLFTGLFSLTYSPTGSEAMPLLITEVAAGNDEIVQALGQALLVFDQVDPTAMMSRAVVCTDAVRYTMPPDDYEAEFDMRRYPVEADLDQFDRFVAECEAIGAAPTTPEQIQPVTADVPALFLAGDLDPTTPPEAAVDAAALMPSATVAIFEGYGHSVGTRCAAELRMAFIETPRTPPATSCVAEAAAPLDFVTPDDLAVTSMMFHLESKVLRGTQPLAMGALGFVALVMVMELPLFGLWLLRRDEALPTLAVVGRAAGLIMALAVLLFFVLVARAVAGELASGGYTLLVGLPAAARPVLALPWLALLAAPLVVVVAVRAWSEGWFPTVTRLHLTALAAAGVVFVGLALGWDMLLGL